jgi:spore coat polysaccharide biosynthesis protein SpsF
MFVASTKNIKQPAIAIIQARTGSSRLPDKVLLPLAKDKSVLHVMVDRIRQAKVKEIIVATTTNQNDSKIVRECDEKIKVRCFRGSENNVLQRMIDAASTWGLPDDGYIVDLTGDCPFSNATIINYLLYKIRSTDSDYVHNDVIDRSWPDGVDCQIYKFSALKTIYGLVTNPVHFSHSGWNIPTYGSHLFKIWNWKAPEKYHWPDLGLTLDEQKDYIFLKSLYERFSDKNKYPQPFSIKTVINVLRRCPSLITNKDVARKIAGNG